MFFTNIFTEKPEMLDQCKEPGCFCQTFSHKKRGCCLSLSHGKIQPFTQGTLTDKIHVLSKVIFSP
jgi:hypothetical protein